MIELWVFAAVIFLPGVTPAVGMLLTGVALEVARNVGFNLRTTS